MADYEQAVKWFRDGAEAFAAIPKAREEVSKAERRRSEEEEKQKALAIENAELTRQITANKATASEQRTEMASNAEKIAAQAAQVEANDKQLAKQEAKKAELRRLVEA